MPTITNLTSGELQTQSVSKKGQLSTLHYIFQLDPCL